MKAGAGQSPGLCEPCLALHTDAAPPLDDCLASAPTPEDLAFSCLGILASFFSSVRGESDSVSHPQEQGEMLQFLVISPQKLLCSLLAFVWVQYRGPLSS